MIIALIVLASIVGYPLIGGTLAPWLDRGFAWVDGESPQKTPGTMTFLTVVWPIAIWVLAIMTICRTIVKSILWAWDHVPHTKIHYMDYVRKVNGDHDS